MKLAYFDCFSGISGDMCLGALLANGLSLSELEKGLRQLPLSGWSLKVSKRTQHGITAHDVQVEVEEAQPHRHLEDILQIIARSDLPGPVKDKAITVFRRLAAAEAEVHSTEPQHVHFHEVGAVDAIIDIVGTIYGLYLLGIDAVFASPLPLGSGWVKCHHGILPVPAPATVYLLRGYPVYGSDLQAELVTPTGAALITTIANRFGPIPPCKIESSGYGAGKTKLDRPNLLRLIIASTEEQVPPQEEIMVVETTIDDMNPEFYPELIEQVFKAGAVDAYCVPIQMKKGRPGILFTAVCPGSALGQVASAIFNHSTTLGLRYRCQQRLVTERQIFTVETPFGPIQVKRGVYRDPLSQREIVNLAPEFESCRQAAHKYNVPLKEVYNAALTSLRQKSFT
ncbi:MAG: pyridinium-3,5-bisthiocarboxylic acid mononucleotide nickel chelatase [Clostridia bacterium]|nr:pyridinium-3,5-bisthiocarboxylic acid mononucleotide nickel chelatase [Clostridia bacterium]